MKKYGKIYAVITAAVFIAIGCAFAIGHFGKSADIGQLQENHRAAKLYHEGVWRGRYLRYGSDYGADKNSMNLSFNVYKDMTKEDMLAVMNYYEMVGNAKYDSGGRYLGEREGSYCSWGVFFRGDTDEEIMRIKYVDNEEVEITDEDYYQFPFPYMISEEGTGLWM